MFIEVRKLAKKKKIEILLLKFLTSCITLVLALHEKVQTEADVLNMSTEEEVKNVFVAVHVGRLYLLGLSIFLQSHMVVL